MAGSMGFGWHRDTDFGNTHINHEIGLDINGSVGLILQCWRIEIEGSWRRFQNDTVTIDGVNTEDSDGSYKDVALMFNGFYNFEPTYLCPLSFYLGGGIGIDSASVNTRQVEDSDVVFAWQVMSGLAYEFCEHWSATLGYRFFATGKPEIEGIKVSKVPFSNNVDLGLRVRF